VAEMASRVSWMGVAELNDGMMAEDVALAVEGRCPVRRYNWFGGMVPSADELANRVKEDLHG